MDNEQSGSEVKLWWLRALIGRRPKHTLIRLGVIVVLCFVVFKLMLIPMRIHGDSMSPTYTDWSINFINKLSYRGRSPQRGDVVGIRTTGESIMYLKRIVGLPNERVAIKEGVVMIDGAALKEDYVKERQTWNTQEWTLAENQYFALGDNRSVDITELVFGPIDGAKISGKILW